MAYCGRTGPADRLPRGGYRNAAAARRGLLGVVDHRDDHHLRAEVERAADRDVVVERHPRGRHGAAKLDRGEHRREVVDLDRRVLLVGGHLVDIHRARSTRRSRVGRGQPGAERRLAGLPLGDERIRVGHDSGSSSFGWRRFSSPSAGATSVARRRIVSKSYGGSCWRMTPSRPASRNGFEALDDVVRRPGPRGLLHVGAALVGPLEVRGVCRERRLRLLAVSRMMNEPSGSRLDLAPDRDPGRERASCEHLRFVAVLVERGRIDRHLPVVGVLRGDPQADLLARRADDDRNVRLERPRPVLDALEVVVRRVEVDLLAGQDAGSRSTAIRRARAAGRRGIWPTASPWSGNSSGSAPAPEHQRHPAVADVVERRGRLGDDARVAERIADGQVAQVDLRSSSPPTRRAWCNSRRTAGRGRPASRAGGRA